MASKINYVANGPAKKQKKIDPKDPLTPIVREQILQYLLANPSQHQVDVSRKFGKSDKYVAKLVLLPDYKERLKYLQNKTCKVAIWDREELFKKAQDLYTKTTSDLIKTRLLATLGKWSGIETSTVNHEFADVQRIQLTLNNVDTPIPEKTDEILSGTDGTDA